MWCFVCWSRCNGIQIITYIPLLRTLITYLPNLKFILHITPSCSKMTHIPLQHKRNYTPYKH
ncbi:hypothetical protein Hanom_Chr08g00705291 [Helianthus anomalus]